MKYLLAIVLCLLWMTGCATISEYNQGCRDGIMESTTVKDEGMVHTMQFDGVSAIGRNQEVTNYYCDMLDAKRREEQRRERQLERGGRR